MSPLMSSPSDPRAADLLAWYDLERRELPWRRDRDPYRVWISEIMLQQTQVKTVIPHYERFLERFPTVKDLAAAPMDEVLALWSGLGYYRRARQMHAAAREIASADGFPTTARELQDLPGIGPYTAAAVASIAFGEAVPVLDGNVERVLCRQLALEEDPKRSAVRKVLLGEAASLLDPRRPGDGNQALMELGATVCQPRAPRCGECPLAVGCEGRESGEPERFPPPRTRRKTERVAWSVALVEQDGRALFFRRSRDSDLLAGLWELPNVPHAAALGDVENALASTYGGGWRLEEPSFTVRHAVTYRALTLRVHRGVQTGGDSLGEGREAAWISAEKRPEYGVPSMFEKVLRRSAE